MISEEDFIDFKCPVCGEPVSFPRTDAGLARSCPICTEDLIVPRKPGEAGRKPPLPISTPRLSVRRFQPGDWKDLMECLDEEEESVLGWLEKDRQVRLTTPEQTFHLGIEIRDESKLIGILSLRFTDTGGHQVTLTVTLNKNYREKDFEVEAVDALLGFCFEGINVHRVTAMCDSSDAAGCRVFEKVGMRREGEFVKDRMVAGEWVNTVWYAALKEEHLEAGKAPPAPEG